MKSHPTPNNCYTHDQHNENGFFKNVVSTYNNAHDISHAPRRAKISSYSPNATQPVIFRHYDHILDNLESFSIPSKVNKDYCTIFVLIEHNIRIMINNTVYTPGFGDIIIIRNEDTYQPVFLAQNHIEYYEINIPKEFLKLTARSAFHKILAKTEQDNPNIISTHANDSTELFHILGKMDSIITEASEYADGLLYSYLIRLGVFLSSQISNSNGKSGKLIGSLTLHKAIEYISANYLTISGSEEIADYCHVSTSYLCRIFKKQTGLSPIEFINSRKLTHAKYLLKKGCNVTEACYSSGFNSYNYFISIFKSSTGQTPLQFKKSETSRE